MWQLAFLFTFALGSMFSGAQQPAVDLEMAQYVFVKERDTPIYFKIHYKCCEKLELIHDFYYELYYISVVLQFICLFLKL